MPNATSDWPWNAKMVNAPDAVAMLPTKTNGAVDWGDICVAQLDTGISQHPVFNWHDGKSDILRDDLGVNYVEGGTPPRDPQGYRGNPGHGTRTASVLCGDLDGSYSGIAPGLPTIPYRVSNSVVLGKHEVRSNIAKAIRHAIDQNGCDVITISMGIPMLSWFSGRPMGKAVDYAYDRGVMIVAAGGQQINRVVYPGKAYRTISVGGIREDRKIWFDYDANSGPRGGGQRDFIDIWAPAAKVPRANTHVGDDGESYDFGPGNGTSFATPHVTAAAAMWLRLHRENLNRTYREPWMRIEAFRQLIQKTAQKRIRAAAPKISNTGILDIKSVLDQQLPTLSAKDKETRLAVKQWQ